MKDHRKSAALAGAILTVSLSACSDDDQRASGDMYERPQQSRDIISDEQLRRLEDAGAEVYGGNSPPNIEGTYYFGDREVVFTDSEKWPSAGNWCHKVQTYEQGDTPELYVASATSPTCNLSDEGTASFISGDGSCFTLYSSESGEFDGCYTERVEIMSACLSDEGDLLKPVFGSIIPFVEDSSACGAVVSEGRTRAQGELAITAQVDEIAERQN